MAVLLSKKLRVPLAIDVDDDWWSLPDDNPFWLNNNEMDAAHVRWLLAETPFLITTNEHLAKVYRAHREQPADTVLVLPNMISLEDYAHEPYDNGDKVVIGWFGGSSHYRDLNETGFLEALQKIMHQHKNVEFHICDAVLDTYLPTRRVKHISPQRGLQWLKLFQEFRFDIGVAPLDNVPFAEGKSDIKWQEYSAMGAAFIGSNVGPYRRSVRDKHTGLLVANTPESWYAGLENLVVNATRRKELANNAYNEVKIKHSIEANWGKVKEVCETINRRRDYNVQAPELLPGLHKLGFEIPK
jgi:glycosyltransferase involved in cell wall biosynthesis